MGELTAQLTAFQAFLPVPIDLLSQIAQLESMIAGILACIAAGIPPPTLELQMANMALVIAGVASLIAGMEAQISIINNITSAFASAGIHAYAFNGQTGNFGSEMSQHLNNGTPGGTPLDSAQGVTLITTTPASFAALTTLIVG
jgi:hypothetical protein